MRDDEIERIALTDATPKNAISALCETRDGGLLIGTHHDGLLKWKDGKVERVFTTPDGAKTLIHAILEARTGDIWLAAASSGLWRFHSGEWKRPGERSGERLIATALMESAAGDLWIGTLGQGLVRFHADHLTAWTREDGLISDTIVQMLEDDAGNLWLGTDAGLQRVSPAALAASRAEGRRTRIAGMGVTREDGLPTPQFSGEHGNLATRTPDGSLWFSLASGAIRVQPERFAETSAPPAILIESASADRDELWNHENPRAQEGMAIEPGAGTLRIRFTAPDFIAPEKMRFKYRMAGLETGWQENAGARNASYASLPPGTYQFQMMGAAHDGTWSPAPVSVKIVVKPFFWQTTAFRAFASIASLAALTYLLWTWSLRRIRRRMALLEQERRVEKERARIAQDLHDELGASLTEINFLGTLAAGSIGESPARKRMEGIVDRAQRMAKSLDEIVWTVNPANDSLSSTANYLCSRAQECLRAADIRCRLEIDEHLPAMTLDSELRHHLLMAVNEAVNNVMKHSGTRDCTLRVSLEHGSLIVCVEDTGAGFDAHHPPSGRNGLTNLKRRMENIGGRCTIDTTPGRGTRVRLVIPLLRASGTRFDAGAN
jgi:signal transduction histidine kinase